MRFARACGIEGSILLSTQSFARKLDQMIGDETDAKQRFNLPPLDGLPRHAPERPSIIGEQADAHQQIGDERQAALQVGSRQPRAPGVASRLA